ncbi:MAG: polysaccharide biosynthesis tyrosine autokinase [Clostridiales bacterium]|nr:polysaccharide biosynthesis tyrosine autokinase [Clostridiales bacterium]
MSELITKYDPKSPISEVFRLLRTNIQYINKDEKSTSIMLTSTAPANGKTFVTANLAITLAQANKRVILVDSDIRKPRLHKVFELENTMGLSDYLRNSSDGLYIRKTNIENLSIVTAGTMVNNPSELIGQEKFKKTIEALKEKYDYVIIDSSPILMVTDSILVSRVVDATILIAIYNKTRIDDLKSAVRRINYVGGNVAGVVVNRTKVILSQYNTKYFYGNTIEVNNKSLRMKIKRFFYNQKVKKANKNQERIQTKEEKKQIKEEKIKSIDKNQKMINKINMKNQELEKELLQLKKELENQKKIKNEIQLINNNEKAPKASMEKKTNLAKKPQINKAQVEYVQINKEKNNDQLNSVNDFAKANNGSTNNFKINNGIENEIKENVKKEKAQETANIESVELNVQTKMNSLDYNNEKANNGKNNNEKTNNDTINNETVNNQINTNTSNKVKTKNPKINNNAKVLNKYMANILKDINNA